MSSILADEFALGCAMTSPQRSKNIDPVQLVEDVLSALLSAIRKRPFAHNTIHQAVYDFIKDNMEIKLTRDLFTFWHLDIPARVNTLKRLIDAIDGDEIARWKEGMLPEMMRMEPIGYDSEGWTYWTFDNTRLYREMPMNLAQQKTAVMLSKTDYTFELVCRTADEWREHVAKVSASARGLIDKILAAKLSEIATVVIGRMEALEASRAREEARIKKAEMLEMIPRKRSRRLEEKEDELKKRRKLEELEEQRQMLEVYEKKQEEKRLREKKAQEEEMLWAEERKLRDIVAQIIEHRLDKEMENTAEEASTATDIVAGRRRGSPFARTTPKIMFLKELRGILRKGASLDDRVAKMQGWASLLEDGDVVKISPGPDASAGLTLHRGLQVSVPDKARRDLTSPVLMNILRVYLSCLPQVKADTGMDLQTIKKKLLLKRYRQDERNSGIENFIEDLDLAIPQHIDTGERDENNNVIPLRQYAAELLTRIFQNT
ncbi:hypothetical protein BX666DRAFT_2032557 [Dichotomocladium elegans]|nr:hypothetical protein BX666DRAFT_2032557 [Dichotomocladium elegans]